MKRIKRISASLASTLKPSSFSDSDIDLSTSPGNENEHMNPVWRYTQTYIYGKEEKPKEKELKK